MKGKIIISKNGNVLKIKFFDSFEQANNALDKIPTHEKQKEFLERMRKQGNKQINEDYTDIDVFVISDEDNSADWKDGKLGYNNAMDYL